MHKYKIAKSFFHSIKNKDSEADFESKIRANRA